MAKATYTQSVAVDWMITNLSLLPTFGEASKHLSEMFVAMGT
jgi:hypothetical protein